MRTVFLLRGLPASSKSTFAADLCKKEPCRFARINRDDLRSMVVGYGNDPHSLGRSGEDLIRNFKDELIRQSFREGYDVILDDTHLVPQTVKKLHKLFASIGDVKVIEKVFNVDFEECIVRDSKRTGFAHIGEKIIRDMARGAGLDKKGRKLVDREVYYAPRWSPGGAGADPESMLQDVSLPKAIICDLDGTLSLLNGRSPYDASTCDNDLPNVPVIECVKAMALQGYKTLFTSGRENKFREPTIKFIEQHCNIINDATNELKTIDYDLFMRATGDQRKDSIVKSELFDANVVGKYNVVFVLDDRNQVVDFWRRIGLTVFQVAEGNF
jgi:predicted kinase